MHHKEDCITMTRRFFWLLRKKYQLRVMIELSPLPRTLALAQRPEEMMLQNLLNLPLARR